jgi:hypothetical protein
MFSQSIATMLRSAALVVEKQSMNVNVVASEI